MNEDMINRLTTVFIDCFILNNGFSLPEEGNWQTTQLAAPITLYCVDMPDFLKANALYLHWKSLKERDENQTH